MKQSEALKIMLSGANVFLTGPPGSGKTFVLNEFIEESEANGKNIAITASTGMAASHIGGTTIHSWSGLGIAEGIDKNDLRRLKKNDKLVKRYRHTDILVIDEVSMLHGRRLDMVNLVAKTLRESERPFGGIQIVLVGDLFQLPPVERERDKLDFAHMSYAWEIAELKVCYLTEQHRQAEGDDLLALLIAMRQNSVTSVHRSVLTSRTGAPKNVTRLYSHNVDVDSINQRHLDALPGKVQKFSMMVGGQDKYKRESLVRNILAPMTLELKVGAEVMFVANNFSEGFFNGMRGTITKFTKSGLPVVKMVNGRKMAVEKHKWTIKEDDRVLAFAEQIPLRLAWAITIHKSQGMTLDAAEVDLTKAFMPGMGYVALSRVRSIDGLFLKGFNDIALTMHESIHEFDVVLREMSQSLITKGKAEK